MFQDWPQLISVYSKTAGTSMMWRHFGGHIFNLISSVFLKIEDIANLQYILVINVIEKQSAKDQSCPPLIHTNKKATGDTMYNTIILATPAASAFKLDRDIMTPSEAKQFDIKADDGKPGSGIIRARSLNNLTCISGQPSSKTATYQLSQTGNNCALIFQTNESGRMN
jgi:type II secretory pathway pseudopilin PulG